MIKIKSPKSDELEFICSSQDEIDFCESNKNKIFDKFVEKRTHGKFKKLNDYLKFVYDTSDYDNFGTIGLKAHLFEIKELNMDWNQSLISDLEDMFNSEFLNIVDTMRIE